MTTLPVIPRRVEWTGPSRWTVWADEDGVHVRTPHGDVLEAPDLTQLMNLVNEIRGLINRNEIPVPRPLSKSELPDYGDLVRRDAADRAVRAVKREFAEEKEPF